MKKLLLLVLMVVLIHCESSPSVNETKESPNPQILKLVSVDVPLSQAASSDWLAVHPEKGQSFKEYKKSKPITPGSVARKIYLQPIGQFSKSQFNVIQFTADYLKIFFDLDVSILPILEDGVVPDSVKRFRGTEYEQLLTTSILNYLQRNIPSDGIGVMAVTSKDLYGGAEYNFVFGQARTKKRVAVSSIFRFYTEPLDSSNYSLCLERLIKTSSHEISHMFSLQHCTYAVCIMNGSNSLSESDARPNRPCFDCHCKLQWNLKFNVKKRLQKLEAYFKKHNLDRDHKLALRDLATIDESSEAGSAPLK
jgi:archaemetzincin